MSAGEPDESEGDSTVPEPAKEDAASEGDRNDWEKHQWEQITAHLGDLHAGGAPGPRDYAVADDVDESGFIEPDPPMRTTDPLPTLAWLFGLGGPILTILFLIVWPNAPSWVYLTAILTSIAGWLVLLWRIPRGRDPDDPDDGGVV